MGFELFETIIHWSFERGEVSIHFFLMILQVLNSDCNLTSKDEKLAISATIRSIKVR